MKHTPLKLDESGRYLLPFKEAASRLSVSRETLYRWVRQGLFPEPIKQGKRSFYILTDIEAHISKLRRTLNPSPTRP